MLQVTVNTNEIKKLLRFTADKKEIRVYLQSINMEILDENTVRLAASNGHLLVSYTYNTAYPIDIGQVETPHSYILDKTVWGIVAKYPKETVNLHRYWNGDASITLGERTQLLSKGMDLTYPNVSRVIPETVSGEAAYFDIKYIQQLKTVYSGCHIYPNGSGKAAKVVVDGDPRFVGVLMPQNGRVASSIELGRVG